MSLSDYVFNQCSLNVIKEINKPQIRIVFVRTSELDNFMQYRKLIRNKNFIIICHNSDKEFNEDLFKKYQHYNDTFFSQNCTVKCSKVIPIPIGLENRYYHINGIISSYKKYANNRPYSPAIFYSFSIHTNPTVRLDSYEYLKKMKFTVGKQNLSNEQYLNEMSRHMFCFSPPGNGLDTHRTWEAIALNVIPICFKSPMIESFIELGLPIWVIDDINELGKYQNAIDIRDKYFDIQKKSDKSKSYFDYWKDRIERVVLS